MASGMFLKGFPIANVNGTYNCLNSDVVGTNRIWESVDKLYRLRYKPLDSRYDLTEDICFVSGKKYYRLVDGQYVLDTDSHGITDEIPANVYYERTSVGRWEVVPIEKSVPSNNYVYAAELDDETIVPYHPGVVWEDIDGVAITSASVDYWDESSFSTVTSEPVIDEATGTVTTVTTTTNLVTGDVYRETNVVRTKDVYVQKPLVRFDNMNLTVGRVYRFRFISDFESLGYILNEEDQKMNSGIYKLDKIISYLDLVSTGIDLYANLYQPLNIKKDVYDSDVNRLGDTFIYKLIDPTDESVVVYMPQIFIQDADPSVEKYNKVLLAIDMGIFGDDPDFVTDVEYSLQQIFEKKWGIKHVSDKLATVTIYDHIWLTTSQKEELEKKRRETMRTSPVSLIDLFDFRETNQIFIENRRLKGRVKALEEALETQKQ